MVWVVVIGVREKGNETPPRDHGRVRWDAPVAIVIAIGGLVLGCIIGGQRRCEGGRREMLKRVLRRKADVRGKGSIGRSGGRSQLMWLMWVVVIDRAGVKEEGNEMPPRDHGRVRRETAVDRWSRPWLYC